MRFFSVVFFILKTFCGKVPFDDSPSIQDAVCLISHLALNQHRITKKCATSSSILSHENVYSVDDGPSSGLWALLYIKHKLLSYFGKNKK